MKFGREFMVLGLVCVLSGCSVTPPKPTPTPKPIPTYKVSGHTPTPTPTLTPTPATTERPVSLPRGFKEDKVLYDFATAKKLSNSSLEYCSNIIELEPYRHYLFTWNLEDGTEIYACEAIGVSENHHSKLTVTCDSSDDFYLYEPGVTKIPHYYRVPEVGVEVWPVRPSRENDTYYDKDFVIGMYSDFDFAFVGDDIICNYYWYYLEDDKPVLIYQVKGVNRICVSATYSHPEIWDRFQETKDNIVIERLDYEELYDKYRDYESQKRKLEEEKEGHSNRDCDGNYDYLDLYELNSDLFEDEDDAYDYWMEYCQ